MSPFAEMALNNAYANRTLYSAIAGLDHAAFTAPRPGFFSSISKTLNHIYEVDLFYIDALEEGGLGRSVYQRDDIEDVSALGAAQAEADMRLAMFCQGEIALERIVDVERKGLMTQEKIGEAGIAPPQLDDFFLEYDRAEIAKAYFR